MAKKMRRNSYAEGAAIAYVAIVLVKILGALYSIPFYNIIGDRGGFIYTCAYNIYAFFYDIATSGVPVAISIIIGEYNSLEDYASKEKAYKLGRNVVVSIAVAAFLILQFFARPMAMYFLRDMNKGARPEDVTAAVRAVSVCLLLVPLLSMKRGYLQGHKIIGTSSTSQVIEQFVRIAVVLLGSYLTIRVLHTPLSTGINVALIGTAVGAAAALIYIEILSARSKEIFPKPKPGQIPEATKTILKKIASYCLTIVIVSVAISIYNIVDMKLILVGLHRLHFSDHDTQTISSVASNWVPKICNIITALAIGMTSSIAPHVADDHARGNLKGINEKINQSMEIIMIIAFPMAIGITLLSRNVYGMFYGPNEAGSYILKLCTFLNAIGSMVTVIGMGMQSMNRGRVVCVATVVGIVINASLDLPLIYLFHRLGLRPYLGATAASIIGQLVTFLILIIYLHQKVGFTYHSSLRTAKRLILPLAVMTVALLGLRRLWPTAPGRLMQTVQFGVMALICVVLFLPIAYKTKALDSILKEDFAKRFLAKLHIHLPD